MASIISFATRSQYAMQVVRVAEPWKQFALFGRGSKVAMSLVLLMGKTLLVQSRNQISNHTALQLKGKVGLSN